MNRQKPFRQLFTFAKIFDRKDKNPVPRSQQQHRHIVHARTVPRISLKLKKIRRNKKFPFRHPNYDDSLYCNLKTDFQILRKELRNKRRKFLNSSKKLQFILKYFLIISMRAFKVKKGKMLKHYRAKKMPKLFANSAL